LRKLADQGCSGRLTPLPAQNFEEPCVHSFIFLELAKAARGHSVARRFLDPSHLNAEMARLHHHGDATRVEDLIDSLGDLAGQPLLQLKAPREEVDQPGQLAETDHPAIGQIADVAATEER
jgi:hypothetical protein